MRRLTAVAAVLGAAFLLSACAAPVSTSGPSAPGETTSAPEAGMPTGDDIQDRVEDAEWSFAPAGLLEPLTLAFHDGVASDPSGRTYEIGAGVEGDADGNGIPDLAVPVSQLDGNGFLELWYVWLGTGDDAVATQLVYPIARTARCGDVVRSVTSIDSGFRIDETLWMPHTDQHRDCASGGTGSQVRDVSVATIDGVAYPIQTAPVLAWGGVCPRSEWLDGIFDETVEGRAAPPASAPTVFETGDRVSVYELPEATLLTKDGVSFFGFQTDESIALAPADPDATAVTMHCAFAG